MTPLPPQDTGLVDDSSKKMPGRRAMSAGHVVQVCLIAMLVGGFLNAPGLLKTAEGQNFGWKRTVARSFAHPLKAVSHFMYLDRPRESLEDAIGKKDVDDIKTFAGPSPTTVPLNSSGVPTPAPPEPEFYTPNQPLSIWVAGDSLAQVPGDSLRAKAAQVGSINMLGPVDSRVATGLARPEIWYWPQWIAQQTASLNPHVVVLTFGANDDQTLTGNGMIGPFNSDAWKAEYSRRVGGLMDQIVSEHRYVIWIGIPIVRDPARNARYGVLNSIYEAEAKKRKGKVFFVNTYDVFKWKDNSYSDYAPDNPNLKVRTPDGIHYQPAGGDMVADAVLKTIRKRWDVDTWRKTDRQPKMTTTTSTTTTTAPKKKK